MVCMYTHVRVVSSTGYTDLARSPLLLNWAMLPKITLKIK